MKTYVYKVKNKERLKAWGEELKQREAEARETLVEENCYAESMGLFEINGETYAVGFMVEKDGKLKFPNMDREINQKHFQVLKECVGEEISTEVVYEVKQ